MKPYELCIINPTRMKKPDVVPGVIVDEAKQLVKRLNMRISVVMFHELNNTRIYYKSIDNDCISLFSIPMTSSRGLSRLISSYPRSLVQTCIVCRSILRKCKIALIRSDDTILTGIPGKILSFLSRKPHVIVVAGSNKEIASFKLSSIGAPKLMKKLVLLLVSIIERIVVSNAKLLVISEDLADYYFKMGGRDITWTPTFLDFALFSPGKDAMKRREMTTNILFVGRLEPEKGITSLIQAFAKLSERRRNLRLTIVGDGSLKSGLLESVRKKNLESHVSFLGNVDHQELPTIYQTADIFVLPSYTEGLPVAMLEAMASKLPVVVTPVGLVPQVVKHLENGILIEPGNISSIVTAITGLLKDKRLRARIAERGYHRAREFSGSYIDIHLQTYSRILSRSYKDH